MKGRRSSEHTKYDENACRPDTPSRAKPAEKRRAFCGGHSGAFRYEYGGGVEAPFRAQRGGFGAHTARRKVYLL